MHRYSKVHYLLSAPVHFITGPGSLSEKCTAAPVHYSSTPVHFITGPGSLFIIGPGSLFIIGPGSLFIIGPGSLHHRPRFTFGEVHGPRFTIYLPRFTLSAAGPGSLWENQSASAKVHFIDNQSASALVHELERLRSRVHQPRFTLSAPAHLGRDAFYLVDFGETLPSHEARQKSGGFPPTLPLFSFRLRRAVSGPRGKEGRQR